MPSVTINRITTRDACFQLKPGEGADAVHTAPQYAYAVAQLHTDQPYIGVGLALFTSTLSCGTTLLLAMRLYSSNIFRTCATTSGIRLSLLMVSTGRPNYQDAAQISRRESYE